MLTEFEGYEALMLSPSQGGVMVYACIILTLLEQATILEIFDHFSADFEAQLCNRLSGIGMALLVLGIATSLLGVVNELETIVFGAVSLASGLGLAGKIMKEVGIPRTVEVVHLGTSPDQFARQRRRGEGASR